MVERVLLVRHISTHPDKNLEQIDTHDLALNRAALARLAALSGYPEATLRTASGTRLIPGPDPTPVRAWIPLRTTDRTLVRPCSHCAARRGLDIPAIVRIGTRQPPFCVQHARTLVPYQSERGREQPLTPAPEILAAHHRYKILRRRHRHTIDEAYTAAADITGRWRSGKYKPEHIDARWQARSQHLPDVPDNVIRYPETIALTALFTATPSLLHTPTRAAGAPSAMQFLLAAAYCLDHPAPAQLLRTSHPLFRWANTPNMHGWFWRNAAEPDRTIYRTLASNSRTPVTDRHSGRRPTAGERRS
ncbi:hypothetical protein [Polymorphospora sp. NPDC050346]|uniref:hypothetical protein n=1 Tax=Polymorphospora sp. NPDC050346 TaxID=3155780 RepID=UPI0034021625